MTVYTPNIPQPGDNPSNSQDQILQNFETLNTVYGTSGDHYAWTNTTPVEGFKHAKVTLPGLPTTNAPGNIIPAPLAGNCTIFSQTRNSQTTPFVSRDGLVPGAPLTNIWPLLPIKAYATFILTGAAVPYVLVPIDSFNVMTINVIAPAQTVQIIMSNAMRTTNYGVIAFPSPTQPSAGAANYSVTNTTTFLLNFYGNANTNRITVIALEP